MDKIRIAIVGLGKIARDQHLPSIAASGTFELAAIASPHSSLTGVPCHRSIEDLLQQERGIDAVALCTTPQVRYQAARHALEHGCHVLLEKPPGATLGEVDALVDLAERKGVALFASWHSRFAAAVEPARAWLATRKVRSVTLTWKEDVRVWHPGQGWIWKGGGLGVFDPGINALSILTRILPRAVILREAELSIPSNCETPIAARLQLADSGDAPIRAEFDFRQTGLQTWDIDVQTDDGSLLLSMGGSALQVKGQTVSLAQTAEYPLLYAHFAALVRECRIDVDLAPLQLVADALLCGRHRPVEAFVE